MLYGFLKLALLFYLKLVTELEEIGFVLNPYDPCVANKMFSGRQVTITFNFDDYMISHKDEYDVTNSIDWFKSSYL